MKNGRPVIVVTDTSGKAGKDWRADVRAVAAENWGPREPFAGKMYVTMDFYFARPKSHYGTGKNAAVLKPSAPPRDEHLQDPDALKLARAVEDALTKVIWKDDNQLAPASDKHWVTFSEDRPGMMIAVGWEDNAEGKPC